MIPILYEIDETSFTSNGLGRLRDCISCVVTEERNGIYECDFEYPMNGAHFDEITVGRIIGVTHDDTDDIQPFDIVSYTKPIEGIVEFHCTHISYRQSYMTVTGTGINSLADAFTWLSQSEPENPFTYWTNKTSAGYLGASNGIPHSVRQVLGGMQGSILDAYGGEYEWDKWSVKLYDSRGEARDFSIRYGVNMLDYNEEYEIAGTYSSCIPYWTDGTLIVVGNKVDAPGATPTGRGECVPLDLSDKFDTEPSQAQVETMALSYMTNNEPFIPRQSIEVEFLRLQDLAGYEEYARLLDCNLCDTINVIFPDFNSSGRFKIVSTVWDVLRDRYESMELGHLSTTLAEALGISSDTSGMKFSQEGFDKAANAFESALSAKNPLTVSDYIRVVGSDNVSYKQGMESVRATLNSMMPIPQLYATSFANLESQLDALNGRYIASVSGTDGATSGLNTWTVIGFKNADYQYAFQYAFSFDDAPYVRIKRGSSVWGDWQKMPTRAEVDALATVTSGTVAWDTTNVTGDVTRKNWWIKAGVAYVSIEFTPNSGKIANGNVICTGMPRPRFDGFFVYGGNSQQMIVKTTGTGTTDGALHWYFPSDTTTLRRIDITLVYPI